MGYSFLEFKEVDNLIPIPIPEKEDYYRDLADIEQSCTGRIDVWIANTFILESVQLIINSIVLFEKGYFDCAFFSLRQSLEVSTTMVYLIELDEIDRKKELSKWKRKSKFPMYGQMLKFLSDNGSVFIDVKNHLNDYFEELKKVKESLNKYVHKQGFDTFYVSRNHFVNRGKDTSVFLEEFSRYIISCIGALAILRLIIDPLPVLLMDEEIYSRTGDILTEPYSDEFVKNISEKSLLRNLKIRRFIEAIMMRY